MVTPSSPRPSQVIYLAGPISGNMDFNLAESARITKLLRDQGHDVIDAAAISHGYSTNGIAPGYDWHDYMSDDIPYLIDCTAICLRPQWPYSRGAVAELTIAATIGLDVYFWLEDIQGMIQMGERI
jgi:hypothetical protein